MARPGAKGVPIMHPSAYNFIKAFARDNGPWDSRQIIEVGSYGGSDSIRWLFPGSDYTGLDLRPGPGVDHVVVPRQQWWPSYYADLVICAETLEHDLRPWKTVRQIFNALRWGGRALITCRGFDAEGCFPYHEHPGDYWRFTPTAVRELLLDSGFGTVTVEEDPGATGVLATALNTDH